MKTTSENKERLGGISKAMARIHKLLLENEMEILEVQQNEPIPAAARLNLLLNSPDLDWLRTMSKLMVKVDEVYFQKEPITDEQMTTAQHDVEELLMLQSENDFAKKYRELLVTVPNLMFEHGHLRVALKAKAKVADFS